MMAFPFDDVFAVLAFAVQVRLAITGVIIPNAWVQVSLPVLNLVHTCLTGVGDVNLPLFCAHAVVEVFSG